MVKAKLGITKMSILAGMLVAATSAFAFKSDGTIVINCAAASSSVTVRYSGVAAERIELRINGVSVASRSLDPARPGGETNFAINLQSLRQGDNEVVVNLFNREGKLVGTEKTFLSTDDQVDAPVYLSSPRPGATVSGPVTIKLGSSKDIGRVFVSFYIDDQFRSMMNVPPFVYVWDTSREPNGWKEIEAWVVDEASNTLKTKKVKVFVNNPSGMSPRTTVTTPVKTDVTNAGGSILVEPVKNTGGTGGAPVTAKPAERLVPVGIVGATGPANGLKPAAVGAPTTTGPRQVTPTGKRVAETIEMHGVPPVKGGDNTIQPPVAVAVNQKVSPGTISVKPATTAAAAVATSLITVTKGQKLPNVGNFSILYNTKFVEFPDVQPMVQADGVPLTPFRHLFEQAGGKVDWEHLTKTVNASMDGSSILIAIGSNLAKVDGSNVEMERTAFIVKGRTMIPLSFLRDALKVDVEFDPVSGHVLITNRKAD